MLTSEQIEKLRTLFDNAQTEYAYAKLAENDDSFSVALAQEWRKDYEKAQKELEVFIDSLLEK